MYNSRNKVSKISIYIFFRRHSQDISSLSLPKREVVSIDVLSLSCTFFFESREISKTSASEGGFLKKRSEWGGEEVDKWDSERVSNVWRRLKVK